MAENGKQLHIVVFPWLAFGHIMPFFELAKFIALKGHKISFISTPRNIKRLPKPPPNFDFVQLKLPPVHGLPENAEATMDVRPVDIHLLKEAFDDLETGLTQFLESSNPDWIIYDFAPHWLPPVAADLGISKAVFFILTPWFMAFLGPPSALLDGSHQSKDLERYTVQPEWIPFPRNLAFRLYEIERSRRTSNKVGSQGVTDEHRHGSTTLGSDVIVLRHCVEFEPEWLDLIQEIHHKPVVPVGLMPSPVQDSVTNDHNDAWVSISQWLEKQNKGSVVYVALGSEVAPSQEELTELALGLELSGLPFFWALRKPPGSNESDSVKLPDGFVERIGSRGVVWTSWAPQMKILSHDSVGGFLTHCGWSSIIEGLEFGCALIMLPFAIDQGFNARILAEKKVGIEILRSEQDGSFTRNSVAESMKSVMVDDEGRIYKDKAKEISTVFGDKDQQNRYMDNFVKYLEDHKSPNKI